MEVGNQNGLLHWNHCTCSILAQDIIGYHSCLLTLGYKIYFPWTFFHFNGFSLLKFSLKMTLFYHSHWSCSRWEYSGTTWFYNTFCSKSGDINARGLSLTQGCALHSFPWLEDLFYFSLSLIIPLLLLSPFLYFS